MKRLFLIFLILPIVVSLGFSQKQNYSKVRIYVNGPNDFQKLIELGLDLDCQLDRKNLDRPELWVSHEELENIRDVGFNYEVLIEDWDNYYKEKILIDKVDEKYFKEKYGINGFGFGSMGGFYTFAEVVAHLDSMRLLYPNLISTKVPIGYSIENRPLWMVKISDNPDTNENEPQVLYTALHHAREPQGMMVLIYYMYYLLEKYGIDPEVTYLVNNREIYFIPVVNPDGYEYNRTINPAGGGMWRKNRRNNGGGTYGVDLNRNYGPYAYWDAPNGGSSTNPSHNTYRGTSPFSEPETDAIREFLSLKGIKACLNYHTYSNLLIYPYGALNRETPDSLIYREFARDMTAFNGYVYGTDQQTVGYTTRGNSDDYMYDGEPVSVRPKIFAMTPEVGSSSDGFWPPPSRIFPLAIENLRPNLYYTWIVGEYPTINSVEIIKNGGFINKGDTISIIIELKNKGLENAYNVGLNFQSLSPYVTILGDNILLIDTILARSVKSNLNNPLIAKISNTAPNGTKAKIAIDISLNGIVLIKDTLSFIIGQPTTLFTDDFEFGTSNWTLMNQWGLTTSNYHSPAYSVTESPTGNYPSNANTYITLSNSIDLSQSVSAVLEFWTKWDIEPSWDFAQVKISTNNGASWIPLSGKYTKKGSGKGAQPANEPGYDGTQSTWVKEEIDLTPFVGHSVKLRFHFASDGYIERDGWYIDDIVVRSYQTSAGIISTTFSTSAGWNLVSIPLILDNYDKDSIFPTSISNAYAFSNGYVVRDTLKNGEGYWLKFSSNQSHTLSGLDLNSLQINLNQGWNLIGGINYDISVSSLSTEPPGIIQGNIYAYNNGYVPVSNISPGKAYWIKTTQNGILNLVPVLSITKEEKRESLGKIIIKNSDGQKSELELTENNILQELPPIPPDNIFDARFNGKYFNAKYSEENIITLNGVIPPFEICFESNKLEGIKVSDLFNGKFFDVILTSGNSITINKKLTDLKIRPVFRNKFEYSLLQNYPNPFNPITNISFTLKKKSFVELKVFDILGNEIKTLISDELPEGHHSIKFDGKDLASGIYFYKLKANDYTDVKKMILIK